MRMPPPPSRGLRSLAAGVACLALATSAAMATTLRRMDLSDLVARADRVVHARAVDQIVYWDPTGTQIYTDTIFDVVEEAKGHGPKRLTVTMHGGRIDPVEISSPGTPTFSVGAEAVLFTTGRPDGKKNLAGFSQGHMRVVTDETGRKSAVSEVPTGVTYIEQASGQPPRVAHPRAERLPLEALLDQVRALAGSGPDGGRGMAKRPERVDVAPSEGGNR